MNTRMLLSCLILPMLLGACCSPPDLQANWYSIPSDRSSTSAAAAPSRLVLAILNRGERGVKIVSIEVNPPTDEAGARKEESNPRPWTGNMLKGKVISLESGESRMIDLSFAAPGAAHQHCHLPVRLRLKVTPFNSSGNDGAAEHAVMLPLRDPMPSALPPGWEQDCIWPPRVPASAPG